MHVCMCVCALGWHVDPGHWSVNNAFTCYPCHTCPMPNLSSPNPPSRLSLRPPQAQLWLWLLDATQLEILFYFSINIEKSFENNCSATLYAEFFCFHAAREIWESIQWRTCPCST